MNGEDLCPALFGRFKSFTYFGRGEMLSISVVIWIKNWKGGDLASKEDTTAG